MSLAIFQILEGRRDNVTLRERKRFVENYTKDIQTSMHSSRMRTTRLLTIPRRGVCLWGVSAQGVSAQWGVCPGGLPREVCPGGCLLGVCLPGGVCLEGCLPRGVCLQRCLPGRRVFLGVGFLPHCMLESPLPPPCVNRIPDRCKNIILPQTSFAGGNKCKTVVLKIQ